MVLVIGITSALKLKCDDGERVTKISLPRSLEKDDLSFVVNCKSCQGITQYEFTVVMEKLEKLGIDLSFYSKKQKDINCGSKYLEEDIALEDMWKRNFTSQICTDKKDCRVAIQYFGH